MVASSQCLSFHPHLRSSTLRRAAFKGVKNLINAQSKLHFSFASVDVAFTRTVILLLVFSKMKLYLGHVCWSTYDSRDSDLSVGGERQQVREDTSLERRCKVRCCAGGVVVAQPPFLCVRAHDQPLVLAPEHP